MPAQLPRARINLLHFGSSIALDKHQRVSKGDLHVQLLLEALRAVWEGGEHLQSLAEVANSLEIRRVLESTLARPVPVNNRLPGEARLRIMLRQQLRLCLGSLRKVRL